MSYNGKSPWGQSLSRPQPVVQEPPIRGFGDVIAFITKALGKKPCGPCEERRQRLNRIWRFR